MQGAILSAARQSGRPARRPQLLAASVSILLGLAACAGPGGSDSPSANPDSPSESAAAVPSVPTIDPADLASIVSAFEEVTGLRFETAEVSEDLAAVGVQEKYVGRNDVANIVLLVLDQPVNPADEEVLMAGTEIGGTIESTPYATRGGLFLAWRTEGPFPPTEEMNLDVPSPLMRVFEQVPLTANYGE